jgi:hypothetical protein
MGAVTLRSLTLFALLSIGSASIAWAEPTTGTPTCSAIVKGQTAQFIFPLPKRQPLTWNRGDTGDNVLEYLWQVSLEAAGASDIYEFGIYLFKFPGSVEAVGSPQNLLAAAQASVWERSLSAPGAEYGAARIRSDLVIQPLIDGDKLIVRVADRNTFAALFSHKPNTAHCKVRTPYEELNFEAVTPIQFVK